MRPHPTTASRILRSIMAEGAVKPKVRVERVADMRDTLLVLTQRGGLIGLNSSAAGLALGAIGVDGYSACGRKDGLDAAPAHPAGQASRNKDNIPRLERKIRALRFQDGSQVERDLLPVFLICADKA